MSAIEEKRVRLREILRQHGRVMIAYSGGIDSAYLAWEAHEVLGEAMCAVLADSPSLSRRHLEDAIAFAHEHAIPLQVIETAEMERGEYVRNDGARCFHCKDELFQVMERLAADRGFATIAYGRNLDDSGDFRPGQKAAEQHRAVAPLAEAELGKAEIRELARRAGLRVWDKPASACLSSRIEYGRPVTAEALRQVEQAEEAMAALGFRQVRVRHHGQLARVEIERSELPRALKLEMLERVTAGVRAAGFVYVTLDTSGYQQGSMNALLSVDSLRAAQRS